MELIAISPDSVEAWRQEGGSHGVAVPMLSHPGNAVWMTYGTASWMMASEPGHTFFLVGGDGKIAWLRDYGAPEHGGRPPSGVIVWIQDSRLEPHRFVYGMDESIFNPN